MDSDFSHESKRFFAPWNKSYYKPRQHIQKQWHPCANKVPNNQSYAFSSSHVWMWELDHKEGWAPKNRCFQIMLEKTLESPLDSKEIKPVYPKGNQLWRFIARNACIQHPDAEALILWPPDAKSWLTEKEPDAGKDLRARGVGSGRGWEGLTAHWLNGHEWANSGR